MNQSDQPTDKAATLLALAERCEQATGPSIALDCAIEVMCVPVSGKPKQHVARCYTSSLDAALTLVREGWGYRIHWHPELVRKGWAEVWTHEDAEPGDGFFRSASANPALAIAAAALRAQAQEQVK